MMSSEMEGVHELLVERMDLGGLTVYQAKLRKTWEVFGQHDI